MMTDMNLRKTLWMAAALSVCSHVCRAQEPVEVEVNPDRVENRIDEKLYGFLLEHLYHSVSNGIWGENVWNRSFEERLAYGDWTVDSQGELTLNALNRPMADFRICRGKDYELTLEVKRLAGDGPVLVGVRDQNRDRMLTNRVYWHLGAEHNTAHRLELSTGWVWHTPVIRTRQAGMEPGMLPTGEWVQVKVRCEGRHLTGWVNGRIVFDRTDDDCPKDGAITLGGENCRVTFRRIQVTTLDGKPLEVNLNPVRHWRLVGSGSVQATDADALNQDVALHLRASGKQVGVEQPENFSVRKDDRLVGSLYLKGTVDKVSVRLMDGKRLIDEQCLQGLSATWKEYPLTFVSRKDVPWATLSIQTEGSGDLYIDQVSLRHQSSIDNGGFRVELTKAATDLHPAILRWPGGSFSEQYRFEHGIGPQSSRRGILRWDDFDPLSFGTDEFIAFCRKVGAEPQIVVPIGYHNYAGYAPDKDGAEDWLQRALDWMDYCNGDTTTVWGRRRAANGHPEPYGVKYWELDNETWKMSPKLYVEIARLFSIAMRKRYPDVKIIGSGCGRLGREGVGLDSILIHDAAPYFDYISPHYYQTLNKYGNDGVEEYGRYLDQLSAWIAASQNPQMKIYVSEWNLDGIDMRTGLFAGGFLNRMERTSGVEMAAPALFLRHTSATGWNNAFINFHQNGWFAAPNYVVLKLWRDHYLPNRIRLTGTTRDLNIVATASDDKQTVCLKIVNPTAAPIMLKVKNGVRLGRPTWEVVGADSLTEANSMEHPHRIKPEARMVATEGYDLLLNVPPHSASVLTVDRRDNWMADNGNGTFTNPIFYENFCDPDIIRVGDEYYATGTTMHSMPGLPLLHSKDLVNWEILSYCFDELNLGPDYRLEGGKEKYGRGIWAPCIRHHNNTFYIWTDIPDYGSIVYSATNPRGPWKGEKMNGAFHDASVLFDDDGKTYITWGAGKIYMAQLDENLRDTLPGTCQMIFTPERKMNEGCHLYKIDGRYYLTNIWWKTNPMSLMCARADNPYGPWEINRAITSGEAFGLQRGYRLKNPRGQAPYGVIEPDTTDTGNVSFAQGGLVQTTSGEWWGFVHNDYNAVGRPTALAPVTWQDGWPYFGLPGNLGRFPRIWRKPDTKLTDTPRALHPCNDDFEDTNLGVQWQWNHVPDATRWSLVERPGVMRLYSLPSANFWLARNSLTQNGVGPVSQPTVELDVSGLKPGDNAGLALLNRPYGWIGVVVDEAGNPSLMQYDELTGDTARTAFSGQKVWLRAHCDYLTEKAQFAYSLDGKVFADLGPEFTMFFQNKTFQGVRYTLYNYNTSGRGGGYADFDNFQVYQPHPYGLMRPIPCGKQIVLTNRKDGKPLKPGGAGRMEVEDCSLGRVALKTTRGYLSIDAATGKAGVRTMDKPGLTETFQWIETPYGDLALLSLATNRYLNVAPDGSLNANAVGPKPSRMGGTCLTWAEAE